MSEGARIAVASVLSWLVLAAIVAIGLKTCEYYREPEPTSSSAAFMIDLRDAMDESFHRRLDKLAESEK